MYGSPSHIGCPFTRHGCGLHTLRRVDLYTCCEFPHSPVWIYTHLYYGSTHSLQCMNIDLYTWCGSTRLPVWIYILSSVDLHTRRYGFTHSTLCRFTRRSRSRGLIHKRGGFAAPPCQAGARYFGGSFYEVGGAAVFLEPPAAGARYCWE